MMRHGLNSIARQSAASSSTRAFSTAAVATARLGASTARPAIRSAAALPSAANKVAKRSYHEKVIDHVSEAMCRLCRL